MTEPGDPYSQYKFLVEWNELNPDRTVKGGFDEVAGLGREMNYADFRNGNSQDTFNQKICVTNKAQDVTLKRGLVDATEIHNWIDKIRSDSPQGSKTMTITLRDEDQEDMMRWHLSNAQPVKWNGPACTGTSTELAIEELVLTVDGIQIESID